VFIKSNTELDAWIGNNCGLHDASVVSLVPSPEGTCPQAVNFALRFQVAGGYAAGDNRTIRTVTVVAHGVHTYELAGSHHPDNCAEGANSYDAPRGVGFEIDVSGILQIAADCFEIESTVDIRDVVPEWLSDRDFTVSVANRLPPTPAEWLNEFQRLGRDVVWRYHAGEERSPERVPISAYTGWFLQKRDRLESHTSGLFFRGCACNDDGFSLTLERYDPECNDLWIAAGTYLSGIANATIQCGNATLTLEAFRKHLRNVSDRDDSPQDG